MSPFWSTAAPAVAQSGKGRWLVGLVAAFLALSLVAATGVWMIMAGLTPTAAAAGAAPAATPEVPPELVPFSTPPSSVVPQQDPRADLTMAANQLAVPGLGISASVQVSGLVNNHLLIPSDPTQVTRYVAGGDACGDRGTVLLAGNLSHQGQRGSLYSLATLTVGTRAFVTCADARVTQWLAVQAVKSSATELPQDILNPSGEHRMVIVTSGGPVMPNGHYRDNIVTYWAPYEADVP